MSRITDITAVILAGGKSERFGENKAFAPLEGKPLIERVLNVLKPLFEDLLIVTNTPDEYAHLGIPIVQDLEPFKGPLGGIVTALQCSRNDRVFVVACDMPILEPQIILEVIEKGKGVEAAIPTHGGIQEYLMALYSRSLANRMECCLREDRLSLDEFCRRLTRIAWVPITGDSFFNVNTRKDLELLEKHHAH